MTVTFSIEVISFVKIKIGKGIENCISNMYSTTQISLYTNRVKGPTPPTTPRIRGLKSQILKPTIFELKLGVKSGLEFFILKFY